MKLTTTREALAAGLAVAEKACGRGDYTSRVLLEAAVDGGLRLTGSDDHYRAMALVDAEVASAGTILAPPRRLREFLDVVPKGSEVALQAGRDLRLVLQVGTTRVSAATIDPEPYPGLGDFYRDEPDISFRLLASTFADMVGSVAHVAEPDATEPKYAAIEFRRADGVLSMFSVSQLGAAVRRIKSAGADFDICVWAERLKRVAQAVAREEGEVRLAIDPGRTGLLVDAVGGSWLLRALDAKLPPFKVVTDRPPTQEVICNREALLAAMRLASNFTVEVERSQGKGTFKSARTLLDFGDVSVGIVAGEGEDDQASTIIESVLQKGAPFVLAVNAVLVKAALDVLGAPRVVLEMDGPMKFIVLRDETDAERSLIQMVAPIYLNRGG